MYTFRYVLLKPVRFCIRWLARGVGAIPGTTYGEVAEMHTGPCQRCVGRAVQGAPES